MDKTARFNPRIETLSLPPVPAVQAWAAHYDGAHGPLIDLSQAVPGYPPHPDLLVWLGKAAADPATASYGAIQGDAGLRRALADHMGDLYRAALQPDHLHLTSGCNQAFIVAAMAVAGAGDTIALTNPCYFNHETSLAMLGIGVDYITCRQENGFVPTIGDIEAAIRPATRAIALVSPNNPTGAIYPDALLEQAFDLCRKRGIWLILDETYRDFLPDGAQRPHGLFEKQGWEDTLIQLYSFSKSYCIPGHRLGSVAAGRETVGQIVKIMDNLQICAPRPPQGPVARAIGAHGDWREANRALITQRAQVLRDTLVGVAGWELASVGAYFAFLAHPFENETSRQVAQRLATDFGVVTIPGGFFGEGLERYLRVAFANVSRETLQLLGERLRRA
jgi:aspartate/methionine/tyrosine aminotransferase